MRYVYRKGGLRPPVPPEKAAEEINRVRGLCGGDESSLPRRLWQESKKKNAPFHSVFAWNDAECGELWRTHQARMLIATVYIVESGPEGEEEILAPAFPNIAGTESRDRSYEPMEVAMASDEMRAQLLTDAKQRLKAIRNKYRNLTELASVWSAIDQAAS